MKNKITWKEKYAISLNDELSTKDICLLFDIGRPKAASLRNMALEAEGRDFKNRTERASTTTILQLMGKEKQYFLNKMKEEKFLND